MSNIRDAHKVILLAIFKIYCKQGYAYIWLCNVHLWVCLPTWMATFFTNLTRKKAITFCCFQQRMQIFLNNIWLPYSYLQIHGNTSPIFLHPPHTTCISDWMVWRDNHLFHSYASIDCLRNYKKLFGNLKYISVTNLEIWPISTYMCFAFQLCLFTYGMYSAT